MKTYDIHERIFQFVVRVIKFLNQLPKTPTNLIFLAQITRSVTSIGANDQEADGALTKKDFIHCYTVVRKEGKETVFWLRIIGEVNKSYEEEARELVKEGSEIVAIVSSIMKSASANNKERK
jgi:four helix bundle protein